MHAIKPCSVCGLGVVYSTEPCPRCAHREALPRADCDCPYCTQYRAMLGGFMRLCAVAKGPGQADLNQEGGQLR